MKCFTADFLHFITHMSKFTLWVDGWVLSYRYPDIFPWTMKFPQGNWSLDICPQDIFPWIIPPEQLHPGNCHPWNSSRNKWQRTFALDNYPWITYRWRSIKALFTRSSLEILNDLEKNKLGAVHGTSWKSFL